LQQFRSNCEAEALALYYLSVACERDGIDYQATTSWIKAKAIANRSFEKDGRLHHLNDAEISKKFVSLLRPSARFSGSTPPQTEPPMNQTLQKHIEYQISEVHPLTSQVLETQYLPQPAVHPDVSVLVGSDLTEISPSLAIEGFSRPGKPGNVPANLLRAVTSVSLSATATDTVCAAADTSTAATAKIIPAVAAGVAGAAVTLAAVNTALKSQEVQIARRAANAAERSATTGEVNAEWNQKHVDLQMKKLCLDIEEAEAKKKRTSDSAPGSSNGTGDDKSDTDDDNAGSHSHSGTLSAPSANGQSDQKNQSKADNRMASQSHTSEVAWLSQNVRTERQLPTRSRESLSLQLEAAEHKKQMLIRELMGISTSQTAKLTTKQTIGPNEERFNARKQEDDLLDGALQILRHKPQDKLRRPASASDVDAESEFVHSGEATDPKVASVHASLHSTANGESTTHNASINTYSDLYQPASEAVDALGEELELESEQEKAESSKSERLAEAGKKEAPQDQEELCSTLSSSMSGLENKEPDEAEAGGRVGHGITDIELAERTGQASADDSDR
jgi:hypothetical protein